MSLLRTTPKNLEALRRADPYEFCVIGSGPAGTVVACDLAEAGHDVLLLESGNGLSEWLFDPKLQNLAAYSVSGTADYPTTKTKARLVGGNSNFWTGRSERLHPSDFETHPYTPVDGGWPIGYEDLDPYYHKAEKTLNVAGGLRSADAPPRDDEHQPLVPPKTSIAYLKKLFAQADTTVDHSPTAKPTRTFRFFNIQKERLAKCLHLSNLTLVSGVSVTKLHSDSGRGVSHALCRTPDLGTLEARAKRFVVACGGIESARLLLLSANDAHPNGLGNQSDMVGRGFNEHPATNFYARVRHTAGTLMPTNKIGRTHQFYSDYRDEGLGSVLPVYRQAWVLPHHVMPFRVRNIPTKLWNAFYRLVKPTLYMGATIEQSIEDSNRVTLSRSMTDLFGNPSAHLHFDFSERDLRLLDRSRELCRRSLEAVGATDIVESEITWSRHHQGTCRMGANPKTSVVDKNLKVHSVDNLYVAGCESFVTGGAMQPCLTIVALSHRLAEHLHATSRT